MSVLTGDHGVPTVTTAATPASPVAARTAGCPAAPCATISTGPPAAATRPGRTAASRAVWPATPSGSPVSSLQAARGPSAIVHRPVGLVTDGGPNEAGARPAAVRSRA